ncbi:hypothetical protein OHD50_21070 [Escherichia coli]|nr:hypothetical protein [Escherichia coli]
MHHKVANTLNAYGPMLPELFRGLADLAPSNLTIWKGSVSAEGRSSGQLHSLRGA